MRLEFYVLGGLCVASVNPRSPASLRVASLYEVDYAPPIADSPPIAIPVHPLSYGSNYKSAADIANASSESGTGHPITLISTAVCVPVGVAGTAGLWALRRKRAATLDSSSSEHRTERLDQTLHSDEESLGDTTEDAFESKFEVGNDAAMWAHQADFSAF